MKTTEEFIKQAKEIHNNKYRYSKVDYKGNKIKVCVTCTKHGDFFVTPNNHLRGVGCPMCAKESRAKNLSSTSEIFIKQAKEIHGDKYDYSKVEYVNSHTKVCIICPEHGEFWQKPNSHLLGNGCPKCYGKFKKSTEIFIKQAKEIHGDRYDYSKVEYTGKANKICLICPEHGEFWIRAENHTNQKQGCPKCGNLKKGQEKKLTKEIFIKQAKEIHGDKYDYSKVEYINSHTKICIICPEHGEFWQTPSSHLQGEGCPKCNKSYKLTTESFIQKAIKIHGDKYDYSKVNYKNCSTKVCIICPEHGEFWQIPYYHLSGNGCSLCGIKKNIQEQKFLKILEKNFKEEKIEYQKRLSWLGRQSFDFYLPDYNIAIELQGEQHFKPVELWGGEYTFKKQLKRDYKKKELCDKNNILLLYYVPQKYYKYNDLYETNSYFRTDRLIKRIKKEIEKKKKEKEQKKQNKKKQD